MKKIFIYIIAICCFSLSSCNFLDEVSNDEVRPSSVDDLVQLMLGEGYTTDKDFLYYLDLLSDDVQNQFPNETDLANNNILKQFKHIYQWDENMYEFSKEYAVEDYNHWEYLYKKIMGCNVILDMIDEVDGTVSSRENLRGQAYAMRAFYYFTLVNIYSMPYNADSADSELGVPIILEPQVKDGYPAREPLSKVYEQIISDLTTAYPLLNKYGEKNIVYRASDKFVNAILSRVYLYMGEWEKSIEFSNYIIDKYPSLQKLSSHIELIEDPWFPEDPATVVANLDYNVYSNNSVERLWAYGSTDNTSELYVTVQPGNNPTWSASVELIDLYVDDVSGANDCRKDFYFMPYLINFWGSKGVLFMDKGTQKAGSHSPNKGVRTAEIYLNRAEANIMLAIEGKGGDIGSALNDINTLRESRFNTLKHVYTPINITDKNELLQFCKDERRRELAFESHRWFDMRRWGMLNFIHTTEFVKGQKEDVKFDNPKKYALPIPLDVIVRNYMVKPNLY